MFTFTWQVSLLYENESPEDILLKEKLDKLCQSYPNFKVRGPLLACTLRFSGCSCWLAQVLFLFLCWLDQILVGFAEVFMFPEVPLLAWLS